MQAEDRRGAAGTYAEHLDTTATIGICHARLETNESSTLHLVVSRPGHDSQQAPNHSAGRTTSCSLPSATNDRRTLWCPLA